MRKRERERERSASKIMAIPGHLQFGFQRSSDTSGFQHILGKGMTAIEG